MRNLIISIILLTLTSQCLAQAEQPEVIFQTGFATGSNYSFSFSPQGKYLLAQNEIECILWDTNSGKQLKKITFYTGELPTLYYFPALSFSNDERLLLIPRFPSGVYELFDLVSHRTVQTFKPETTGGMFTHALFSADSKRILLLEQGPGSTHPCSITTYTTDGINLSNSQLKLPKLFDFPLWLKIIFRRSLKSADKAQGIYTLVANDNLDRIYFGLLNGKVYGMDLKANRNEYFDFDLQQLRGIGFFDGNGKLALYKNKLILKSDMHAQRNDQAIIAFTDSLYIADPFNMQVEAKKVSNYTGFTEQYRSVWQSTLPIGTNQSLNVYFNTLHNGEEVNCLDVLTDKPVFSYKKGRLLKSNNDGDYLSGTLNGGYVVAVAQGQQLMAEYTRELVIHNIHDHTIRSVPASAKGQMKLSAPVYIDNTHLFIPKFYNDGFLLNLKTAEVSRLNKQLDYADTAYSGTRAYFYYDNTAQIGLETAFHSKNGELLTTDFTPQDGPQGNYQKRLVVWDANRHKKETLTLPDRELTYYMARPEALQKKYLINHKLFSIDKKGNAIVKEMKIITKKDTFYALKPIYLPRKRMLVSVLATRSKPGNPDLIFANWDTTGKLLKQYTYKRKKNNYEFQALVYDTQISPDSSRLLFALHDGTAGLFDIDKMRVSSVYEHGALVNEFVSKLYIHNSITAACFLDDQHFLTNGDNLKIYLWTVGKNQPDKVINVEPVFLYSMAVSPDKRYITGVDINKTVHMINLSTGQTDLYFVAYNADAYAMIGPNGYYTTNKHSGSELSFLYNGKTYEYAQFDLYLNRPDKVMETLGYANKNELNLLKQLWHKRIENLDYASLSADTPIDRFAPECRLTGLPTVRETGKNTIQFKVTAKDLNSTLSRLYVSINGIPLHGAKGLEIRAPKNGVATIAVTGPLTKGLNQFSVSVRNKLGIESLQQTFRITYTGNAPSPTLYLVAIGSGKFVQKEMNLKYAAKDTREVVRLFKSAKRFARVVVDTLIDAGVTWQNIAALKTRLQNTRRDDQVILYYSGHGKFDKANNYYLSTYRSNFKDPANGGSIAYKQLEWLLDGIPAQNKVMLIDACYSGEADKTAGSTLSPDRQKQEQELFSLMRNTFTDLNTGTGTSVITSSGSFESAYEFDSLNSGVFVHFLKQGLTSRDADLNGDGKITVTELAQYLDQEVSVFTERVQRPTLRSENIIKDVILF